MLTNDLIDPLLISETASGQLSVSNTHNDNSVVGDHHMKLFVRAQRYPGETET